MAEPDGNVFWYNRRWYEFTGTAPEQMRGWGWRHVHHPAHIGSVMRKWAAGIASRVAWEDTFPLRRHDGEYRWFLSRALPIKDDRGNALRWFGTTTDVTEQRDVARRACDDHRTLFEVRDLDLRFEESGGPVWVDADPTRIAQVIGNLLQNASKFSDPGARTTVMVHKAGSHAEVRVRDTGIGIEPAQIERMFEPFV